jgi:integrase
MPRHVLPTGVSAYAERVNLSKKTRETYASVLRQMADDEADEPEKWLQEKTKGVPIGTLLPYRTAVKHYLINDLGWSEEEAREALPTTRGRPPTFLREALDREARGVFQKAIQELSPGPVPVILQLLVLTGLRCSEACTLQESSFEGTNAVQVLGKGNKHRTVPLGRAEGLLRAWKAYRDAEYPPSPWVFPGRGNRPIDDSGVRHITRRLRKKYPELGKHFSPHALRHTWASVAINQGLALSDAQKFLGHSNLSTTSRYLHTDRDKQNAEMLKAQGASEELLVLPAPVVPLR